jgi:hypothetical protein
VIGQRHFDNRDPTLREKVGNLTIPSACIPVMKNHQCLIERPAFCDFCPDDIVLFDVSRNVRWKFEPPVLPLKTLIVPARLIEIGRISHGLARKDTKLLDSRYVLRAWKGAVGVKDEIGCFLPFLTAPRAPLIPPIKPAMRGDDKNTAKSYGTLDEP